jgi:hypothetical protein
VTALRGLLFALFQSGLMSLLLSSIGYVNQHSFASWSWPLWWNGWLISWVFAFPAAMIFSIVANRLVDFYCVLF